MEIKKEDLVKIRSFEDKVFYGIREDFLDEVIEEVVEEVVEVVSEPIITTTAGEVMTVTEFEAIKAKEKADRKAELLAQLALLEE